MNKSEENQPRWRMLRRILIAAAMVVTVAAIFYTEENWRGKRAWENNKRELEAKNVVLDWNQYIPPPVPADQNFFKAPKMTDWFVKNKRPRWSTNELTERLRNEDTTATNLNEAAATKYLAWSGQFAPQFDLIREALKRPFARMEGDYTVPYEIPIPNFVASRVLAQVLAQRTKCYLLLGQPEKALPEITLLNDSRTWLEAAPTHTPMTLVAAMINVAITGLYVDTLAEGFRLNRWQEPQLEVIQAQLQKINLAPFVFEAFKEEQAHTVYLGERMTLKRDFSKVVTGELFGYGQHQTFVEKLQSLAYDLMPQGWGAQNTVVATKLHQQIIDTFDPTEKQVFPARLEAAHQAVATQLEHHSVFHLLADIAMPNYSKAVQTFAHNQTRANQAQIVCALERYRLANGNYPETLAGLVPHFIAQLPHDLIGGQPLHYRRTNDGKFVLYSIGWDETNDDGKTVLNKAGNVDLGQGDWVWKN